MLFLEFSEFLLSDGDWLSVELTDLGSSAKSQLNWTVTCNWN